MRQFRRADRLNQQMLRDISELLDNELIELGGGVTTFTSVRLTKDLRTAKVFYSFLGSDHDRVRVANYLYARRKQIRSKVGKLLRMRHIPELMFEYDESVEQGVRIEALLNEIKRDEN